MGTTALTEAVFYILLSLDTPLDAAPGDYEIRAERVYFEPGTPEILHTETSVLTLHILSAALPAQSVHFTQWFHVDSIAEAYHVPVYSEAHWELIGKYMQMARYLGIDTILTPMLTPSLDPQGRYYTQWKLGNPYQKFNDKDLRKKPYRYLGSRKYEGMFLVGDQTNPNNPSQQCLGQKEYSGKVINLVDQVARFSEVGTCLLYTSDAADE